MPRQKLPDQLRGLALLGIVFVNMPFLALSNGGLFEVDLATLLDAIVAFAVVAFAQGKFYLLFSFLFGYSFTLILRRRSEDSLRRRLLIVAAVVGLPAGLVSGWLAIFADDPTGFLTVLSVVIGFGLAPALTGGYVALAALATNTRALALAAPAGRLSLTGYLGESILLAAIFCGWGLGLFGQLSVAGAALVTLLVWVSLELFAAFWLGRFTHGPFEWVLRCWSAGNWLPLRSRPGDRVAGDRVPGDGVADR